MAFHEQGFGTRFQKMGDMAETVFERVVGKGFVRYGLDRPPVYMGKMPPFVRYTPDYLMADRLVEVQGFGKDRIVKIKHEKFAALRQWEAHMDVYFFLYDLTRKRHCMVTAAALEVICWRDAVTLYYEDSSTPNPYHALPVDAIEHLSWIAYDPKAFDAE
jgi:hypothetical protein